LAVTLTNAIVFNIIYVLHRNIQGENFSYQRWLSRANHNSFSSFRDSRPNFGGLSGFKFLSFGRAPAAVRPSESGS
jgi:hypothetical protein